MTFVPPPKVVRKLERRARHDVADHGVFRVKRLEYPSLPRDIFIYECPDWCNVIAETPEGDLVFIWQYRFGTDDICLEIPGGVVDPGEDPVGAAVRELREETGYEGEPAELLVTVAPNPAMQNNWCHTYVVRNAKLVHSTSFDEIEDLEVALVPKKDLAKLLDSGQIVHALVSGPLEVYLRRERERGRLP